MRAFFRKSCILVMDDSTASIDMMIVNLIKRSVWGGQGLDCSAWNKDSCSVQPSHSCINHASQLRIVYGFFNHY